MRNYFEPISQRLNREGEISSLLFQGMRFITAFLADFSRILL